MVQDKVIQVDVAFLTYDPKRCSDSPLVRQDSACVVGIHHLRKHREMKRKDKTKMGPDAYHHYKWYNSMLSYELKCNAENSKLNVIHWHIESGNKEAFKLNGKLFKTISIIIGDQMEHWYSANIGEDGSPLYGSRFRKSEEKFPSKNSNKIAIFTIDDDEATFVVKEDFYTKCTTEVCANNCIECKKFRSPFSNKETLCACFPSKSDFKSIESEDDCESDDDIAAASSNFLTKKNNFPLKFALDAIREE